MRSKEVHQKEKENWNHKKPSLNRMLVTLPNFRFHFFSAEVKLWKMEHTKMFWIFFASQIQSYLHVRQFWPLCIILRNILVKL